MTDIARARRRRWISGWTISFRITAPPGAVAGTMLALGIASAVLLVPLFAASVALLQNAPPWAAWAIGAVVLAYELVVLYLMRPWRRS